MNRIFDMRSVIHAIFMLFMPTSQKWPKKVVKYTEHAVIFYYVMLKDMEIKMKTALALLMALSLVFSSIAVSERSLYTCNDFTYDLMPDGSAIISAWDGVQSSLTIPAELDGHPVTSIGNSAFFKQNGSTFLIDVTIPEGVTDIGDNAFSWCVFLERVHLPDTLTAIGNGAFACCTSLTEINIPEGMKSIGDGAFNMCSLNRIILPDSVESVGVNPFASCSSLQEIIISPNHPYLFLADNALCVRADRRLISYPSGLKRENVIIPNQIEIIGKEAFQECTGIESITLPESVVCIEDNAFTFCTGLTEIILSGMLLSIGEGAFSYCIGISSLTLPDHLVSIGNYAFYHCEKLNNVYIPGSVAVISPLAFIDCPDLTVITFPGSAAESFCKENAVPYRYIDESPEP